MLDISNIHEYNVHSEHGEDGILFYVFNYLSKTIYTNDHILTYVNISDTYKKKNIFLNLIRTLGFKSNVNLSFHNGITPCTIKGVLDMLHHDGCAKHLVHNHVDLLSIQVCGVDFWLLKTYMMNCNETQKPRVIVLRFNYIIDNNLSICVPYAPPEKRRLIFDENYYGASLQAYMKILSPDEYTFVGTVKYGLVGFFVRNTNGLEMARVNIETCLDFSNVIYAKMVRWPQVKRKFWVKVS
jgi:hypothetical protein